MILSLPLSQVRQITTESLDSGAYLPSAMRSSGERQSNSASIRMRLSVASWQMSSSDGISERSPLKNQSSARKTVDFPTSPGPMNVVTLSKEISASARQRKFWIRARFSLIG